MAEGGKEAVRVAAKDYCRSNRGLREVAGRHGVNVSSLRLSVAAYRLLAAEGGRTKGRKSYIA